MAAPSVTELRQILEMGLRSLGLPVSEVRVTSLLGFVGLLQKWNRVYNLTSVEDPEQMVVRHVLDSLAVVPFIHGSRVVDVGAGAGLPGIPLAIQLPEMDFVLIDASAKRARFLTQAGIELGLKNIEVRHVRVEDYGEPERFQTVVSRAFSDLERFLELAGSLCAPHGRILAMKGRIDPWELARIPEGFKIAVTHRLGIPGLDAERHLIEITRQEH